MTRVFEKGRKHCGKRRNCLLCKKPGLVWERVKPQYNQQSASFSHNVFYPIKQVLHTPYQTGVTYTLSNRCYIHPIKQVLHTPCQTGVTYTLSNRCYIHPVKQVLHTPYQTGVIYTHYAFS